MTECEGCQEPISQPARGRRRRFCSNACRKRMRRREAGSYPVRECAKEGCTEMFEQWSHNHRYCSARCRDAAQYQRTKGPSEDVWLTCASEWCEAYFKREHPNQRYCSKQCKDGDMSILGDPLPDDWGERLMEGAAGRRD